MKVKVKQDIATRPDIKQGNIYEVILGDFIQTMGCHIDVDGTPSYLFRHEYDIVDFTNPFTSGSVLPAYEESLRLKEAELRGHGHESSASRKDTPVFSGVMQYFPDALKEIARHSKKGNDKHNPGEPLHWDKTKSTDHADCIARHLIDIGPSWDLIDPETKSYHATALAWRALALLQTVLEEK